MASYKIYRGETVVGDFTLRDDNGTTVTSIDGAVLLLTDLNDKSAEPVVMKVGNGLVFDNGSLTFEISSQVTNGLPDNVGMEIKIEVDGVTRIAATSLFQVIGNRVKDYVV